MGLLKKFSYWIFVFFFLLSISNATLYEADFLFYYTMDDTETTGVSSVDLIQDFNATLKDGAVSSEIGIIDEGYYFTGNDYLETDKTFSLGENYTINFWFNKTDTGDGQYQTFFRFEDASADYVRFFELGTDNEFQYTIEDEAGHSCYLEVANTGFVNSAWHMVTLVKNASTGACGYQFHIFIDAVKQTITDVDGTPQDVNGIHIVDNAIGNNILAARAIGNLDEFAILNNTALSQTQINELYNSGTGQQPPFSLVPTLTINTNLVNDSKNINDNSISISWNGTYTYTTDLFSCNVWNNETLLSTNTSVNLSTNINYNHDVSNSEQTLIYWINCSNANASDTTSHYYYYVDNINPVISSNFVNDSNFTTGDTETIYANFTDTNLFWYEIAVYDSSNTLMVNTSVLNLTTAFEENTTTLYTTTEGNYTVNISVCDNHNAKIKPHEKYIRKTTESVYFQNGYFRIIDSNILEWELEESDNKYKEKLKFANYTGSMVIQSNTPLFLVQSKHKAHIISIQLKKYKDLDSPDFHVESITRIDKNSFLIKYSVTTLEIETESIGDLNFASIQYTYSVTDTETLNTQLLTQINNKLTTIQSNSETITEAIEMLPLILLWLGLWVIGYWGVTTHNAIMGMSLIALTIPIDIYFIYKFQETNILGTGFVGIGFLIMSFWTIGILLLMKATFKRNPTLS